jgi:hypothetical protein
LANISDGAVERAARPAGPIARAALALPKGKQVDIGIGSLSCVTARRCLAVGFWSTENGQGIGGTLAELWNGHTWRIDNPGGPGGVSTVSCSSASRCVAIGQPGTATLAKLWNGCAGCPAIRVTRKHARGVTCG